MTEPRDRQVVTHRLQAVEVILGISYYLSLILSKVPSLESIALRVGVIVGTLLVVLLLREISAKWFWVFAILGIFLLILWRPPRKSDVKAWTVRSTSGIAERVGRKEDLIEIPPGHVIDFVSGVATEWTHDPLDGIQSFLRSFAIRFPFSGSVSRRKTRDSTDVRELMRMYREVVNLDTAAARKYAFAHYVDQLAVRLKTGRDLPFMIDVAAAPDSEKQVAREFWKRAVANAVCPNRENCPDRFVLGPFYDTRGRPGEPGDSTVPLPGANMGALVAVGMKYDTLSRTYLPLPMPSRWEFNKYGDSISNPSRDPMYIRLLINDDIPQDNSPIGSGTIRYIERSR